MRTLAIALALFVSFTTATAQTIEQAKNFILSSSKTFFLKIKKCQSKVNIVYAS